MTSPTGNGAAGYQLVESPAVISQVNGLVAGLTNPAARRLCAAALRAIRQRLRTDPRGFGEHQYTLWGLRLDMHLGVIAPLSVRYGVHRDRNLVVVQVY